MAGKRGRSGANKRVIFSLALRVSLSAAHRDLLPFFQQLAVLPANRRSDALLAAIRGGQAAAQVELTRSESRRTSQAIDALLGDWGE